MTAANNTAQNSFIVVQVGGRKLALRADVVTELSAPVRLHAFPHTSRAVLGVIIRRGRIIPVYDVAPLLAGRSFLTQRFYLVARRHIGRASEFGALPVSGECELVSGEMQPPAGDAPAYICGMLPVGEQSLDVVDFDALVTSQESADDAADSMGTPS